MRFLDYIFAARPLLHLPVWSIYLVSLHYHLELSNDSIAALDYLMIFALTLAAASSYFINQIYDYESDLINKKLGFLQNNQITLKSMMNCFLLTALISIVIGFYLSLIAGMLILMLVVIGYIYSAPPFRLKDRPLSGFLANAYGFGFIIPLTVMPDINMHNTGLLGWDNPFYFFFTVGAIYFLTTLPDKEGDEIVGKKTVAVLLPQSIVKLSALIFLVISALIAFQSGFILLVYVSLVSIIPVIISLIIKSTKLEMFAIKFPILLLTLLAGYFFYGYFVFIVALVVLTRIYYKKRNNMIYPKLT